MERRDHSGLPANIAILDRAGEGFTFDNDTGPRGVFDVVRGQGRNPETALANRGDQPFRTKRRPWREPAPEDVLPQALIGGFGHCAWQVIGRDLPVTGFSDRAFHGLGSAILEIIDDFRKNTSCTLCEDYS